MNNIFLKLYLIFFLTTIIIVQSSAQHWERELFFRNISSDEGLSIPTISCFAQDSRGYIWIGTVDGLNRYDGYEFKIYQPNPADSNSIPSNRINVLYEDDKYNLWIGTPQGLCQFNYQKETFITYKSDDGFIRVHDISYDTKNNRIWIASSSGGLKYLDLDIGIVKSCSNEKLKNSIVDKLLNINDRELYIGTTNNGVLKLNLDSFDVEEFCNTKTGRFQISSNWVRALHYYDERLFIGTWGGGLIAYHIDNESFKYYTPQNSSIPSAYITAITHDRDGEIYIGTKDGMAIYNNREELFSAHQKEDGNVTALSSNTIRALFVDKNDDLWVGTLQKGIDFLNKETRKMSLVKKKYSSQNSLSGNNITSFAQDDKGGIWIGTQEEGLNYYKDGKYTIYKASSSAGSLRDNEITDICIDHNRIVWVSTLKGGLSYFENSKFVHIDLDQSDTDLYLSNFVRKLDVDKNGILWIGTSQGLDAYDIENKKITHHFLEKNNDAVTKRKNIRTLLVGSNGNIYIGTSTGLYIYYPKSGKSDYYRNDPNDSTSLGHDIIMEIYEDSKGGIWLGSLGGGLMFFDTYSKTFKNYSPDKGFPDGSVASIQEDANGNLWLGTNKGIVKFSPGTEQIVIFGKSYGIQDTQFKPLASTKCKDGRLLFGGIRGFNVFMPEELEKEKLELDVIVTDLLLYDQSVPIFGEPDILSQNISLVNTFSMMYRQAKYFSISFSALQFSDPEQVEYKYMLEGFDDDWNYISNDHRVSFSNLAPDNYVLKIIASENGVWDNSIKEIGIRIIPPFYMETWFKAGIVMIVVILFASFYYYKRFNYKKNQLVLEKLIEEKNKEITNQNDKLLSTNEKLLTQNEEISKQKEYIGNQNKELTIIHKELKQSNNTLEKRIELRTTELLESNQKLNKSVMELDRFVYSASHDLSAPLKSILGLVNIAKIENKNSNLETHLKYIEDSIYKQERVIKSLIQYSRNARQEIIVKPLNIYKLVKQIILDLKYMPGSAQVEIIMDMDKEVTIKSDELRMKMVLNNLLNNGIKYSDRDKKDSFIHIKMTLKENFWLLSVKDNGLGIAENQKEKVFDMFYRATEESDGSGLGLFIVKEAVDRLGGNISLDSTLKEGSVFKLEFPYL